VSTAKPIGSVS